MSINASYDEYEQMLSKEILVKLFAVNQFSKTLNFSQHIP